eukprot:bmy_16581T0
MENFTSKRRALFLQKQNTTANFFNELRKKRQETILEMFKDKSKLSKIVIRVNLGGTPMYRRQGWEPRRLPATVIRVKRGPFNTNFINSHVRTLEGDGDGTGRLYLIGTGECGNSASEKWEIMFNEELGSPFIIIHIISLLKAEEHSITMLLLRTEKEELVMEGSGFYVSLEWVTINKKNKDNKKYEITKHNILRGKSVPPYVAFEPDGNGLMIVSIGQDLEESKDEDMSEKIKEPLYYWQQTEDDLTVTIPLPEDCTKEDIQIQFLPDHVNVVLKGQRFLEGNLYSSMDHESSIWIIKENNSLEISLIKKNEGLTWPELVVGDKRGIYKRLSSMCCHS